MDIEIIIAECPKCGTRRYSWDEQDALYKLSKHVCITEESDEDLIKYIEENILKG